MSYLMHCMLLYCMSIKVLIKVKTQSQANLRCTVSMNASVPGVD